MRPLMAVPWHAECSRVASPNHACRFRRKALFEAMEARMLLSADLTPVAELGLLQNTRSDAEATAATSTALLSADNLALSGRQIVFVDSGVREYETLLTGLPDDTSGNTRVVVLDENSDGIQQITDALRGEQNLGAVHVLSHGSDASLRIGNTQFNADALQAYAAQLATWSEALSSDADILLYGCDVGASAAGLAFIDGLAALTGADVAASNDLTGASVLGGDWDLEVHAGSIESATLAPDFGGLLVNVIVDGDGNSNLVTVQPATSTDPGTIAAPAGQKTFTTNDIIDIDTRGGDDEVKFLAQWAALETRVDGGAGSDTLDFSATGMKDTDIGIKLKSNGAIDVIKFGGQMIAGVYNVDGKTIGTVDNIEIVKASTSGNNTLDLGAYDQGNLTVTIRKTSGFDNEVVVQNGDTTLLTVFGISNIRGGEGNDTFVLEKGAKFTGWIDGGDGRNKIDASAYGTWTNFDLTDQVGSEGYLLYHTSIMPGGGVKNIQDIVGGPGSSFLGFSTGDELVGDDKDNELTGGKQEDKLTGNAGEDKLYGQEDKDELSGGGGNDILDGGAGNDLLIGGLGEDELKGGSDNDTYRYSLDDFGGRDNLDIGANQDTVVEEKAGGERDVLDFSQFEAINGAGQTVNMSAVVSGAGMDSNKSDLVQVNLGFVTGTDPDGKPVVQDKGALFKQPVSHIEQIRTGKGVNTFRFESTYNWLADYRIVAGDANAVVHLDLSAVTTDLIYEIGANGKVTVSQAQTDAYGILGKLDGGHTITADRVHDLVAGKGNNQFIFSKDGILLGALAGGAADNWSGLDYSSFGDPVLVNLTSQDVVISDPCSMPATSRT